MPAGEFRKLFDELYPQFRDLVSDNEIARVARKEEAALPAFRYAGPRLAMGKRTVTSASGRTRLEDVRALGDIIRSKPQVGLRVPKRHRNGREGERHCERSSGRRQKRPAVMDDDERRMVSSPCPPLVPLAAVERALDRLSSSSENRTEGRAVALPRGMTCPNSNADDGRASPAPPTPSRTTQGTHLQRRPRVLADFGCP